MGEDVFDPYSAQHFADDLAGNVLVRTLDLVPKGPLVNGHEPLGALANLKGRRRHGPARKDVGDGRRSHGRACASGRIIGVEGQRAVHERIR